MKQLLLYFMFFVVSAIILVQCAKFFPSPENKDAARDPLTHNNNGSTTYIDSKNVNDGNVSKITKEAGLETDNITESPKGIALSYFWMTRANRHGAVYNPYVTTKSYRMTGTSKYPGY